MNPHDNELDDIRRQWQSIQTNQQRLESTNRQLMQRLSAERAGTKQHKLAGFYRGMGLTGIILLPVLGYMLYKSGMSIPLWMCILYGCTGIAIGILDILFASFVSRTDYIDMPVKEAIVHAHKVLLYQSRLRNAGMLLAAVVLVPIFFHFYNTGNNSVLIGAATGLVAGLAIGLTLNFRKRRMAKRMLADLENDD